MPVGGVVVILTPCITGQSENRSCFDVATASVQGCKCRVHVALLVPCAHSKGQATDVSVCVD